jgi:prepilin-type processing-associated H-X9-DG protein
MHPGGVHVLMADGSLQIVANEIDLPVWKAMSTVAGND